MTQSIIPTFIYTVTVTAAGEIAEANRSFTETLVPAPGLLLHRPLTEYVVPAHRERFQKALDDVLSGRVFYPVRFDLEGRGHAPVPVIWFHSEFMMLESGDGILILMIPAEGKIPGTVDEWLHGEGKLRRFLQHVDDMVYFQELNGTMRYLNTAHLRITGYSQEEFDAVPSLWQTIMDPEHLQKNLAFFESNPQGAASHEAEYRIRNKTGEWRWIQSRMLGVKNQAGRYLGYACIDRDITDLKRYEDVLRELVTFREGIIDSAMVLFTVLDMENNVMMWNEGAREITGYDREEVIGNPYIWEWLYPDRAYRADAFSRSLTGTRSGQVIQDVETCITHKDGGERVISWYARQLLGDNGSVTGIIGLGHDITRRKQAERSLQIAQENLAVEKLRLEQLLATSHRISSILELDQLVDFIPEVATNLLKAKRCSFMLRDASNEHLWIVSAKGLRDGVSREYQKKFGYPIAEMVVNTGEPLLVTDIDTDSRITDRTGLPYDTRSFISVPIFLHSNIVGVVNVADKAGEETEFSEIDLQILTMMVKQAAISIENAFYYREMRRLSNTDPMTGLFNHRHFVQRLDEEINRAARSGEPLSLIMIDVDDFKRYNDLFGHPEGDLLLQSISKAIRDNLRSIDIACRYAGDEFVVILPDTGADQALTVAGRIRNSVNHLNTRETASISMGIAERTSGDESHDLILKADKALYRSKRAGKNKIQTYRDSPNPA